MSHSEKTIFTLTKDIYDVLDNPSKYDWGKVESFGQELARLLVKRAQEEKKDGYLRMSNFGTPCERKLWFTVNKPETAESLDPHVRLKFLYGDIIEALILYLAKVAGHKVEGEQDEVSINGVVGHRDAIIDGVLIDVKSANSRGMQKFKTHSLESDDPFGYLEQLSLYLQASAEDERLRVKKQGAFLAVDKELGHIVLDIYNAKDVDYEKEIESKKAKLAKENPPPRPFSPIPEGKSGNMAIPTPCSYCPHKQTCWADSNQGKGLRGFFYSNGPKWLTKVVKQPDVNEIK